MRTSAITLPLDDRSLGEPMAAGPAPTAGVATGALGTGEPAPAGEPMVAPSNPLATSSARL